MLMRSGAVSNSARDVLSVLFRHKSQIAVTFLVVSALACLATWVRSDVYSAEAKLLIRLGRENLAVDPSVSGPTVNPNGNRENEINSELAILRSRPLAEKLVDTLGVDTLRNGGEAGAASAGGGSMVKNALKSVKSRIGVVVKSAGLVPTLTPRDKAIEQVMNSLSARVEKRSNIIVANFEAKDPELAQKALDRLVKSYMDRHIEVYSAQAPPSFFESQAEALFLELGEREQKLAAFRDEHGITDLERQKQAMLERVSLLENQVEDAKSQVMSSEARVASLQKSLAGKPSKRELSRTTGRTNYAADAFKERLAELRLEETDMAARYPATHRPLVQLREQIEQLQGSLAKEEQTLTEVTTGVDTNYEQLRLALENEQAQVKGQQARQDVLATELAHEKEALAALSSRELELNRLTRDVELAETEYREYRDNLQRAKVSSAMDIDKVSNVSVVQAATALPDPVRPNRPMDIVLGMAAAAFIALFLAFALDYFDDTVSAREHVEKRLGVPVLAVIKDKAFKACP